jgi:hypothetical protein
MSFVTWRRLPSHGRSHQGGRELMRASKAALNHSRNLPLCRFFATQLALCPSGVMAVSAVL